MAASDVLRAGPALRPVSPRAYPSDGTYDLWVEQFDTLDDVHPGPRSGIVSRS